MSVRLSVIVPVGPGESEWQGLLAQLGAGLPGGSEVVVVVAGEVLPEVPEGWPGGIALHWMGGAAGRGRQLNEGTRRTGGEWLWFLHADSRLDRGTVAALLAFVDRGETALGWFELAFRPDGPWLMRLNAAGANWRSGWLGMPFGDQGFVLPAAVFAGLGGFREDACYGEDHLLVWAARQAGVPLRRVGGRVFTSARKYRRGGWARVTARHVWLTAIQAWPEWRRLRRGGR